MSRASWAERKQSWYSGSWDRRSISSWEGVVPGSRMMWAGIPFFRHRAHTPAAAPTASLSGALWPMMKIREESEIREDKALAITRLFTLVRFSVSLERPP